MGKLKSNIANWGPAREIYDNGNSPDHAVFNSIRNHPEFGNECHFVKIAEAGQPYTDSIVLEVNKRYEVCIYYHNNAHKDYNSKANHQKGIARNTKLSVSFPKALAAGEKGIIQATITSENTNPTSVWSWIYITSPESIELHCVENSIKIQTYEEKWDVNDKQLSESELFSNKGSFLGVTKLDGIIRGGEKYAGKVVFSIHINEKKNSAEVSYKNEKEELVKWDQLTITQDNSFNLIQKGKSEDSKQQQKYTEKDRAIKLFTEGVNYEYGKNGFKIDLLKASEYYLKAAEEGYIETWPKKLW